MSNIEKLKQWFEDEKKNGLEDIKFYPSGHAFSSIESFSASVLHTIESIKQGRTSKINEL
jgi:hypothetical protein